MQTQHRRWTRAMVIAALIIGLSGCNSAFAHFIWIVFEDGVAKVYFSEGLEPDEAKFLEGLSGLKVFVASTPPGESLDKTLRTDASLGWLEVDHSTGKPIFFSCEYGLFSRGEKMLRLSYFGKYANSGMTAEETDQRDRLRLELLPEWKDGLLTVHAVFDGKPAKDVELTWQRADDANAITQPVDSDGAFRISIENSTRLLLRGKKTLAEPGKLNGTSYEEHRIYCTLVYDLIQSKPEGSEAPIREPSPLESPIQLPDIPVSLTSFGAAATEQSFFIFGGQMGSAHSYANELQNKTLYCLSLDDPKRDWVPLSETRGTQGLALVQYRGRLFRIGGFEARNAKDQPHDLHSVADFQVFDPSTKQWSEFPSLPEPRSSFDACIVDGKVIVVGGWNLRGNDPPTWAATALSFDLSNTENKWVELPPPTFRRRALAVAAIGEKVFAIGGLLEDGSTSSAVDILDLRQGKWTSGPEIPTDSSLKGFGCAAISFNEKLIVSMPDGSFFQFDDKSNSWQKLKLALDPARFFHRVLPLDQRRIAVVGGANMESGKIHETVVVDLGSAIFTSDLRQLNGRPEQR